VSADASHPSSAGPVETPVRPARRGEGLSEVVAALGLVAVGVYLVVSGSGISAPAGEQSIGPRFVPYLVGGAMVAVGLWLAIAVLRGDRGHSEEGEDVDADASTDWRTLLPIVVTFVGYVVILEPVGYLLSTIALFAAVAWSLGARNVRTLVLLSFLVPFVTYMLFTRALGIFLPNGILEAVI
jgi:putative tricarboxylic transport membrane protein